MLLTCLPFACMITLVLLKVALKVARNLKSNPDFYVLLKLVQGSFSQGNVGMIGETARSQCARNTLFSICLSLIRKIF